MHGAVRTSTGVALIGFKPAHESRLRQPDHIFNANRFQLASTVGWRSYPGRRESRAHPRLHDDEIWVLSLQGRLTARSHA